MADENTQQSEATQAQETQQPAQTEAPYVSKTLPHATVQGSAHQPPQPKTPEQRVVALEKFVEAYRKQHPYCGF